MLVHPDVIADLAELDTTLRTVEAVMDVDELRRRVDELEQQAASPDLWNDQEHAQQVTSQLSHSQADLRKAEGLRQRLADLPLLYELAEGETGNAAAEATADADAERAELRTDIAAMEVRTLLSGEYDERDALVNIRSGAGGVDAADYAEMLLRMYLRWAERRGFKTEVLDYTEGEEAGIKSASIEIRGADVYGFTRGEKGVHRLVRLSPFDQAHRRHTAFAQVEVLPEVEETSDLEINDDDLRIDTYRASGAGGQHVNKTSSAIRITHLPTNIVVTCQNERSQMQNRESAMKILRAKLLELREREREEARARLKGERLAAEFGSQIRSYVLHPYTMVKDNRTDAQTGNIQGVLDGDLDPFIDAYLRGQIGSGEDALAEGASA